MASLSEARPRGLKKEEIAEYMAAPGVDISGLGVALDELARNCGRRCEWRMKWAV